MQKNKLFSILSLSWFLAFAGLCLFIFAASFLYESYDAKKSVEQYVGIWEDDIARAKLFAGDLSLQDKIMRQLFEVHGGVTEANVQDPESVRCALFTDVPVTFNSLPAGKMRVCFSTTKLLLQSVFSPIFMLGLFIGFILLALGFRRELQTRLNEQKLEAELSLNRELSQMARQVAHDIRGPLTALKTLSHLEKSANSERSELLQMALQRIDGIAKDLLEQGKNSTALNHNPIAKTKNLEDLIQALLKEYRFSYAQAEFILRKDSPSSLMLSDSEAIKIQRVLSNLLNNSLEAKGLESLQIHIVLSEKADAHLVQVLDNGKGISEEHLQKLGTEGFSQGKSDGNGLGLFDAMKALRALGGELKITSRENVGTQVLLVFPKVSG